MTMTEKMTPALKSMLDRVDDLSERISRSADGFDAIIEVVDTRLAKLGIPVWDNDPSNFIVIDARRDREDGYQLGFQKVGLTWRTVVRRGTYGDHGSGSWTVVSSDDEVIVLTSAAAHVRLRAAPNLERLVAMVISSAEEHLMAIDDVKKVAE